MRSWQVETQCPQCGAPVILKEAQHVLDCPYCKTRLYLTSRGPFRYTIPSKSSPEETVYLPFWRIKGLGFTAYLPPKTVGTPIDKTFLAIQSPLRIHSLGLRPQASRLTFANSEKGSFLRPRIGFKELLERATRQLNTTLTKRETIRKGSNIFLSDLGTNDPFNQSDLSHWNPTNTQTVFKKYEPVLSVFLDEGNSLIYFPVIPEMGSTTVLNDGITAKPLGKLALSDWEAFSENTTASIPLPGTLPMLCPNCGWDLKCTDESRAVICEGCHRVWGIKQRNYVSIPYETQTGKVNDALYLPFWKIKATIPELNLNTTDDLIKFSNGIRGPAASSPLYIFIPAFKVQPRLFLQICKVFTLHQPETHPAEKIPEKTYPILLQARKVTKLIPIVLAEMGAKKEQFFPELSRIKPAIKGISLAFMPFKQTGYEIIYQSSLTFAIPRNALKWGRRL
jgi:uncharacterized protein YbaR (Trm112 family)